MNAPRVVLKRVAHAEAWQWDGSVECADLISNWVESNGGYAALHPYEPIIVFGNDIAPASAGDWIIRDRFNEFWPLADNYFQATYKCLSE